MSDDVARQLADVIREVMAAPDLDVSDETTAADVEGWDSLAHVSLMYTIEMTFGVTFLANEFAKFDNVGALRRFIEDSIRP